MRLAAEEQTGVCETLIVQQESASQARIRRTKLGTEEAAPCLRWVYWPLSFFNICAPLPFFGLISRDFS